MTERPGCIFLCYEHITGMAALSRYVANLDDEFPCAVCRAKTSRFFLLRDIPFPLLASAAAAGHLKKESVRPAPDEADDVPF